MAAVRARVAASGGLRLLRGQRSYEDMLGYWNTQDSPFKDALNTAPKYVVARTLGEPMPWPNSTLLRDDVVLAVARLKQQRGNDLSMMAAAS